MDTDNFSRAIYDALMAVFGGAAGALAFKSLSYPTTFSLSIFAILFVLVTVVAFVFREILPGGFN